MATLAAMYKTYHVKKSDREPLISFMISALEEQGCRILHRPAADVAPFKITFETPQGERIGIVAYAFLANNNEIRNRPKDEHRFQIKYGSDLSGLHSVWQDPYGLYTTILIGINPERKFFVAVDPNLHNPTRFSVSVEFKDAHVTKILEDKWTAWERDRRGGTPSAQRKRTATPNPEQGEPLFEVLVGGASKTFLQLVRFEREAYGESPGERHYLADHFAKQSLITASPELAATPATISPERLHALAKEFALPEQKVLDLISQRRMLKMAVRGSVAEEHLLNQLKVIPGISHCERLEDDRGPDVSLVFQNLEIQVECKNSSRVQTIEGFEKIDMQRTRAAKSNPCSRYYKRTEFDMVAACIHAVTSNWEFKYASTLELDEHKSCIGRLSNNVKLDSRWSKNAIEVLKRIAAAQ